MAVQGTLRLISAPFLLAERGISITARRQHPDFRRPCQRFTCERCCQKREGTRWPDPQGWRSSHNPGETSCSKLWPTLHCAVMYAELSARISTGHQQ